MNLHRDQLESLLTGEEHRNSVEVTEGSCTLIFFFKEKL